MLARRVQTFWLGIGIVLLYVARFASHYRRTYLDVKSTLRDRHTRRAKQLRSGLSADSTLQL